MVRQRMIAVLGCLLVGASVGAANRCVDVKGRVTYQDTACQASTAAAPVNTSDAFSAKPVRPAAALAHASNTALDQYADAHGT
jgi:hypothetical protein